MVCPSGLSPFMLILWASLLGKKSASLPSVGTIKGVKMLNMLQMHCCVSFSSPLLQRKVLHLCSDVCEMAHWCTHQARLLSGDCQRPFNTDVCNKGWGAISDVHHWLFFHILVY